MMLPHAMKAERPLQIQHAVVICRLTFKIRNSENSEMSIFLAIMLNKLCSLSSQSNSSIVMLHNAVIALTRTYIQLFTKNSYVAWVYEYMDVSGKVV